MSHLSKLNLKSVTRNATKDPIVARRDKLISAIEEQMKVFEAVQRGEQYVLPVKRWKKNDAGEKVQVDAEKTVRSWFFQQDGGWYVQCKYGARPIQLDKDKNAVFVKELKAVKPVLDAFHAACSAGELDEQLTAVATRQSK